MERNYKILVVDDEYGMREGVRRVLEPYGHYITTAQDGREAFDIISKNSFDLALIDLKLPDADGLEILDAIINKNPLTVCIIITAYATLDTAVDATKRGAFDYLAKPFTADQLLVIVDKGLDRRDLMLESDRLRQERDRSLLQLQYEQSRFKIIISCMTDGVIVTNRNGEVVLFNNEGSRFLKDPINVEPGTPLTDCSLSTDLLQLIQKAADPSDNTHITGKEIKLEEEVWLANCAVLRDDKADFLGTVTVFRDITEMKELEKLKNSFISLVAHELRAPVAAIKGYLDIVIKKAAGDNQATYDNMLVRSRERATGLLSLIKDLLDMSRMDAGRTERKILTVDIKKRLDDNTDFLKVEMENRKITLNMELPDEELKAKADPDELNHIMTNLLSNAVKYNKDEGTITVKAGRKGDRVFFSITDTGIGMSKEDQERLFQDFFRANNPQTRKQTGTGLGLAITRRMVEANFGTIEAESEPGVGSTFRVVLPGA